MSKKFGLIAIIATSALIISTSANAGINQRQERQQERIAQGIKSGELTNKEALRLEKREIHIANKEARMRADGGGLSKMERARLTHDQNVASRRIRKQKHD